MKRFLLAAWFMAFSSAHQQSAGACASLASLKIPNGAILSATDVAAGTIKDVPAFCRVTAKLTPSPSSDIRVEVWLPASGWNGKFRGIGNGGYGGEIDEQGLGNSIRAGYAAAATDTGHRDSPFSAKWAAGNPEAVIDFGYRAIHEMTVAAKAIARAHYGRDARYAYFNSCSNGGRQALVEAQRYPADYDGIVAGAAPTDIPAVLSWAASLGRSHLESAAAHIPVSKVRMMQNASLAACDAADGAKDGIVKNPAACSFDPALLQCNGPDTDACLTPPQVETARAIYKGGYAPGAESEWGMWLTGEAPGQSLLLGLTDTFFKHMVFEDPAWTFTRFDAARDSKLAADKLGAILNATNPDLSAFQKRGGRLILYHGWNDAAIPPRTTLDYHRSVVARMGERAAREFVHLEMVPGLNHCVGGPGDPGIDSWWTLIEDWVENGRKPSAPVPANRQDVRVK